MKVIVLGGDGYLGWPTAMHLSKQGHDVVVVDNYMRRRLCREVDCEPLFAVPNLHERSRLWKERTSASIDVRIGDLTDWSFVSELFSSIRPDAVIHYAEQPSAPYSMKSRSTADLTLKNNLGVTFNIIYAVHEFVPECHIVKLGTMGEYGTPNIDIEEGWLTVKHNSREQKFLYPRQAGSLYHTTKVLDTDLLWFYVRTWGLRVTDLMQGPVYGIETAENESDEELYSFFNYDEIFGTVINRFIVQAVAGIPLTVYGKGGQTRGYLNIRDTMACLRLSLENPASRGELRIFNQFVETFSVLELAEKVRLAAVSEGIPVKVENIQNPRKEMEEHYYNPAHTGLLELGLEPHPLTQDTLVNMLRLVGRYRNHINRDRILQGVTWDTQSKRPQ